MTDSRKAFLVYIKARFSAQKCGSLETAPPEDAARQSPVSSSHHQLVLSEKLSLICSLLLSVIAAVLSFQLLTVI